MRPVGTLLQRRQALRIIAASPAVKSLAADSETTAGASHVAAATIKIHPGQTSAGLPAQLFPRARQLARTGKFSHELAFRHSIRVSLIILNGNNPSSASKWLCRITEPVIQHMRMIEPSRGAHVRHVPATIGGRSNLGKSY